MTSTTFYLEAPRRLRAFVRARETSLVLMAALVGALAGLLTAGMSAAVNLLHDTFFHLHYGERLSAQPSIDPARALLIPSVGGLLLGLVFLVLLRFRPNREVDPIEANALHGGRMSFRGSVIVALQTIWSSGVGASVGLEAGYTQLGSGVAAAFGRAFHLRRADQRIIVGCGAAAAIAGAFEAPLSGAFYAFELIVGGYTPASLTPIGVSALAGFVVAKAFAPLSLGIVVNQIGEVRNFDLAIATLLGLAAAIVGIVIMRGVALTETVLAKTRLWPPLRPALGGLIVGALALITPQVLSSGHGALHLDSLFGSPLTWIAAVFALKAIASMISLGSGFRGGLFFASLLLGALGGEVFAKGLNMVWPTLYLDPTLYSVVGMSALSASVIGGPLTMSFIALEATGNLWLTTAVLIAVIISTQLTREWFGYSFATWRMHLRGETIRSAADVGWIRDLTVAVMMRRDFANVELGTPIADFIERFPLASWSQVVAVDPAGNYAGIILVADAHGTGDAKAKSLGDILRYRGTTLLPEMNIQQAATAFDHAEAEALAVIQSAEQPKVVGLLTEAYTMRRYAEESERRRRDLFRED
jgi:CIC family chloride channel protein